LKRESGPFILRRPQFENKNNNFFFTDGSNFFPDRVLVRSRDEIECHNLIISNIKLDRPGMKKRASHCLSSWLRRYWNFLDSLNDGRRRSLFDQLRVCQPLKMTALLFEICSTEQRQRLVLSIWIFELA